MHWSEEIAKNIIDKSPDKAEYVCAAGISPSGSIHIGNFRDVATSFFVVKALRKLGKKAKLLFSWDEFDRFRKVPVNVAELKSDFDANIGLPYVDIEDPFGCCESYAKHFENEFEKSIKKFDIDMDYRYQAQMYRSGKYVDYIIEALKKRRQIFDILDSFRTQESTQEERDNYYPVSVYCPKCGKDNVKILSLSEDCKIANIKCSCGYEGAFDFTKDFNCKLAWKIDWPMRWLYEKVDFEPGGKDHASPTGSFQTSRIIAKEIFGIDPPIFQGYEFIGIKGQAGKMSGSSGLNLTPETLLKIYQPEVILWLYSKTDPMKAFNFCFDDGILRQYHEFDSQYDNYMDGKADEYISGIMYNAIIEGQKIKTVPMALLAQLGSIVNFNPDMLETIFEKIGSPYKYDDFKERLDLAQYWLEQCAPDKVNKLRKLRNWDVYDTLSEEEKKEIELLYDFIKAGGYSLDELNNFLYSAPRKIFSEELSEKELKSKQKKFFQTVYQLLIDKTAGPRLYLFLYAIEADSYLKLLDFSHPKTELELAESAKSADGEESEKIDIPDFKAQIEFDDFSKMDIRVCRIVNCEEIKKSRSCFKLTLFDGKEERVIVSGIKDYYKPEELINKKIAAIVNLKPAKICGIKSYGMLLAASGDFGCKAIFVDESVPEGIMIG